VRRICISFTLPTFIQLPDTYNSIIIIIIIIIMMIIIIITTRADGNRVSKAFSGVCDSMILCVFVYSRYLAYQ